MRIVIAAKERRGLERSGKRLTRSPQAATAKKNCDEHVISMEMRRLTGTVRSFRAQPNSQAHPPLWDTVEVPPELAQLHQLTLDGNFPLSFSFFPPKSHCVAPRKVFFSQAGRSGGEGRGDLSALLCPST